MSESKLLSKIPKDVYSALHETVENHLKSKKFKINILAASQDGEDSFAGIVYRALFYREDDDKSEIETQKLILKVAPQNAARRAQFCSRLLFLREIHMYNVVLPYFRAFEQSKGVCGERNVFSEYPKCYRTVDIELSESVFLEDLSVRGFSMLNKSTEVLTSDHVNLVMQTLGKLHGISIALRDQQPEKFKELTSNLAEVFIRRNDEHFKTFYNKQFEVILDVVSDDEDTNLRAKLVKLLEKEATDIAADCLDMGSARSAAVISHGDTWQNNIMFRYDKNGKPIEISLFDWQMSRFSTPIIDIVFFIFLCITKELRNAHYSNFLKVYYDSLSAHIRRLGSDPQKLFSTEMMQEHFQKFAKFVLPMATMILPAITSDSGTKIDFDELSENVKNGKDVSTDEFFSDASLCRFRKRLRDVVVDMANLNYL